jgi:hypothetical protein
LSAMATKTRRRKLLAVSMTRRRGSCQRWRRRRHGRGRCRLTKKTDRSLLYMCMFTVPFPFHRSMPVAWLVQLPIPSSWQGNSECHGASNALAWWARPLDDTVAYGMDYLPKGFHPLAAPWAPPQTACVVAKREATATLPPLRIKPAAPPTRAPRAAPLAAFSCICSTCVRL